jgi:16S rRNA (uracil1498-N3)-methyltransferase
MAGEILIDAGAVGWEVGIAGEALAALRQWSPRPGEAVTINAGGAWFRARVLSLAPASARLLIYEEMTDPPEPAVEIVLLQALPDKERMELIVEKATELGAAAIVPWQADKGVTLAEREALEKKSHRWPARAKKAARQCRRGRIPEVAAVTDLAGALAWAGGAAVKLALWERASERLTREMLSAGLAAQSATVAILVGPEGGLTDAEAEQIAAAGFRLVTLGSRILRTETAAITAVALAQFLGTR